MLVKNLLPIISLYNLSSNRPRKKTPIVKPTRRAGTRSSARLQHIQPPPTPLAPTSRPARTKWKRPQEDSEAEADEPEGVRPSEEPKELSPSFFAATYQMYFPFLTSEVKCGDGELDVADRQNAYAQSVILRCLHSLFQLVDRENELHREINGFLISHNDEDVRIWGHYVVIDGKDVKFYRHLISKFIFALSGEGDQRWKAYKFVRNVYDLWLPKHFERICFVIDMLPADLNSDVSEQDLASSRLGLSQQLEDYSFVDEGIIPNSRKSSPQRGLFSKFSTLLKSKCCSAALDRSHKPLWMKEDKRRLESAVL
ncbi:hypothetical protein BU26DRAFT_508410 [Trematosphaeria pertusa]|uniref:DUF7924 domain-containing protein n=1 Tax=Trematosphaeria pertusa TaxID=390896 RepID=A0A6A6I4C0_9PLEO|nr:uncharacterized protein BU26DRAFT_508410 [Trematosphaeria pertusa]KAF2245059.1 hypothetical protein BU26DRAFT_508410 [Trematosphaeria pertusa]